MCFSGGDDVEWSLKEQGLRVTIEVRCDNKGDGLYKAYVVGANRSFLLGTMMPEKESLCLRRTLTVDSLKQQGLWPVRKVECRMIHPFPGAAPVIPWVDEVLRRSARKLPRHMVRRSEKGFILSVPFDSRTPFPLVPLFCLSRVEGGRLIFSFLSDGTPYIFQPDGKDKGENDPKGGEDHGKSDDQGAGGAGRSAGI